jgi:hypothetical protein
MYSLPRFICQEQCQRLETVVSSIHEITLPSAHPHPTHHEDVTRPGAFPSLSEDFQDVPELPVNVPAHRHRGLDQVHIRLFQEEVPDSGT